MDNFYSNSTKTDEKKIYQIKSTSQVFMNHNLKNSFPPADARVGRKIFQDSPEHIKLLQDPNSMKFLTVK